MDLHKHAGFTNSHMQRIEGLRIIQLTRVDIALTERRHAQVDESARQFGVAKTAFWQQQISRISQFFGCGIAFVRLIPGSAMVNCDAETLQSGSAHS